MPLVTRSVRTTWFFSAREEAKAEEAKKHPKRKFMLFIKLPGLRFIVEVVIRQLNWREMWHYKRDPWKEINRPFHCHFQQIKNITFATWYKSLRTRLESWGKRSKVNMDLIILSGKARILLVSRVTKSIATESDILGRIHLIESRSNSCNVFKLLSLEWYLKERVLISILSTRNWWNGDSLSK